MLLPPEAKLLPHRVQIARLSISHAVADLALPSTEAYTPVQDYGDGLR